MNRTSASVLPLLGRQWSPLFSAGKKTPSGTPGTSPGAPATATSTRFFHYSFADRRVLVTGGAVGLGRTIVQKFYDDNARLFVLDNNAKSLDRLKQELPKVTTICVDLLKWAETRAALETILPLDHLVNNAGIVIPNPLLKATEADFDQQFGVNVKGLLNVSTTFVKGILDHSQKDGGTIVNISSIGDEVPTAGIGIYCGSKASVAMLTKVMAVEFAMANNHIRVNTICPGFVQSASVLEEIGGEVARKAMDYVLSRTIIKHRGLKEGDVADGVLFFSSPMSAMVTGQTLSIDQGFKAT